MNFAPFAFFNSGVVYDPNAQAFITAAGITDTTQKNAVNQLVLDLKSNSLWSKMYIIYPFIGGTSTTTKYNLVDPATYTITWNGGATFASTGVQGNGTNSYGQTGLVMTTFYGSVPTITTSNSMSVYSRTSSTGEYIECGTNASGQPAFQVLCRRGTGNCIWDNYNASNGRVNAAVTNSQGLFLTSRTSQTSMKGFRNATSFATNTTSATTSNITTTLNRELYILAANNNGTAASYSNRELAFYHWGAGLSDAEVSTFYTIVQTFQTTLSRNV
jgi:hypothetical protein